MIVNKSKLAALGLALVLVVALLAACSSGSSSDAGSSGAQSTSSADVAENSEEVVEFFQGTWRGTVEVSGASTVYGNTTGTEAMIDVIFDEDGTVSVVPCENHEDLLTDEGTWTASDTESVTLHLTDGDTTLTVTGNTSMTGDPTAFDIEGFDELTFNLY